MADWNANAYLKFEKERTRPAVDLCRAVEKSPKKIVDLGCGPGNSTAVLASFFPDADITGIDSSPAMIEKARGKHPELKFELCDVRSLSGKYDLIFSNACLQWVPDHRTLIPALMEHLEKGGTLAVQMPANTEETFFQLIFQLAAEWGIEVDPEVNRTLPVEDYCDILSSCSVHYDIWKTCYYHRLESHEAMAEWAGSTRLRPYREALGGRYDAFASKLVERSKEHYRPLADGSILFPFRRLFFTAEG